MKAIIYIGVMVGGIIGAYGPVLLGDSNPLSGWSLLGGTVGSLLGIWVGYKIYQNFSD